MRFVDCRHRCCLYAVVIHVVVWFFSASSRAIVLSTAAIGMLLNSESNGLSQSVGFGLRRHLQIGPVLLFSFYLWTPTIDAQHRQLANDLFICCFGPSQANIDWAMVYGAFDVDVFPSPFHLVLVFSLVFFAQVFWMRKLFSAKKQAGEQAASGEKSSTVGFSCDNRPFTNRWNRTKNEIQQHVTG